MQKLQYVPAKNFDLEIGDVVMLKSGSTPATVSRVDPYAGKCYIWYQAVEAHFEIEVPIAVLNKIENFDLNTVVDESTQ